MVKLTLGIVKIFTILLAFNSPLLAMQGKSTSIQSVKKKTQQYFEVMQNEILLTNVRYPTRFLFTGGLGPCVGLVLQAGDWIAFAHLDGSPMARTLNKVIAEVKELSNHHPIEATIVTSRAPWELTFRRLKGILDHNGIDGDHIHHIKENTEDSNVLIDKDR